MRTIQLFLPCLPPADIDRSRPANALPAWHRIASRARATRFESPDAEAPLLESFGVAKQQDWPIASFTWLADAGTADPRFRLRADPVHLRADRDALVLMGAGSLGLRQEAADQLVGTLNTHFESDGLHFAAPVATRWYIDLPHTPALATSPLSFAAGRNVDPLLPKGNDALLWHRWFNEIQMLFHSHPVNEAREAAGLPTINSVWFWGGGCLPASTSARWAAAWGDDPLLQGLALAAKLPCAPAPADAQQWLSHATDGEHVVVLDRASVSDLEEAWFAPLLQALKQGQLSTVSSLGANGADSLRLDLTAGDLWKFWRRAPALLH
jgi:hypothetical protein